MAIECWSLGRGLVLLCVCVCIVVLLWGRFRLRLRLRWLALALALAFLLRRSQRLDDVSQTTQTFVDGGAFPQPRAARAGPIRPFRSRQVHEIQLATQPVSLDQLLHAHSAMDVIRAHSAVVVVWFSHRPAGGVAVATLDDHEHED